MIPIRQDAIGCWLLWVNRLEAVIIERMTILCKHQKKAVTAQPRKDGLLQLTSVKLLKECIQQSNDLGSTRQHVRVIRHFGDDIMLGRMGFLGDQTHRHHNQQ